MGNQSDVLPLPASKDDLVARIVDLDTTILGLLSASCPESWVHLDLTMGQLKLLFLLHAGGPTRIGELAQHLRLHVSTVTGIVDRLAERGLVERCDDPADRRGVYVRQTPAGAQAIRPVYASGRETLRSRLRDLPDDELHRIYDGLAALERAFCPARH